LNIAKDTGHNLPHKPKTREEWANLARDLNIKVIHIAERDTQIAKIPRKRLELQSTWSVEGFAAEFIQPAELSWGTHEKHFPQDGHKHDFGDTAIYLDNQSHSIRVRTWAPLYGPFTGFCVPHNEAISIAEYLTVKNEKKMKQLTAQPVILVIILVMLVFCLYMNSLVKTMITNNSVINSLIIQMFLKELMNLVFY